MSVSGVVVVVMVCVAIVGVFVFHFPFGGRSFRDRLRAVDVAPVLGFRLVCAGSSAVGQWRPGVGPTLSMSDIEAIVADCPVPISALTLYQSAPVAHPQAAQYSALARQFGVDNPPLLSLHVSCVSDQVDVVVVRQFIRHRCAMLGIRARLLSDEERESDSSLIPQSSYAQRTFDTDSSCFAPRPHVWHSPFSPVSVPPPPRQLVGVNTFGKAVSFVFAGQNRRVVAMDSQSLSDLCGPALSIGVRIGVRTHRPHRFVHLFGLGVSPIMRDCVDEFDVIIVDGSPGELSALFPSSECAIPPAFVFLVDDGADAHAAHFTPLPRECIVLGQHVWTIYDGASPETVRPIAASTSSRQIADHSSSFSPNQSLSHLPNQPASSVPADR